MGLTCYYEGSQVQPKIPFWDFRSQFYLNYMVYKQARRFAPHKEVRYLSNFDYTYHK